MEDSWRPDAGQGGACPRQDPGAPGHLGMPYSEAWGYFHLAPAPHGRQSATTTWATCRLCGEQVGDYPGFQAWTRALWLHLSGAHLRELGKSGARSSLPAAPAAPGLPPPSLPPPSPAVAAGGDWARLLEQMGALAVRGSRRELELEQREAALRQAEQALERRRRALRQEERAMAQARRQLREELDLLRARLQEQRPGEGPLVSPPPLKEDPDVGRKEDLRGRQRPAVARPLHV